MKIAPRELSLFM